MAKAAAESQVKYDWYQTDSHVVLNILHKNVDASTLKTKFESNAVTVSFRAENADHTLCLNLSHHISEEECRATVGSSKIEVKLKKVEGFRWDKLEGFAEELKPIKHTIIEPPSEQGAVAKQKNWDKVVTEIVGDEDDKNEGEAALNALFQKIYSDGSDEVRKAMNKSFVESGGTVLSTNWGEVGKDKVDVKPPDGMEYKKW